MATTGKKLGRKPKAKVLDLTPESRLKMRKMHQDGKTDKEIGVEFGISENDARKFRLFGRLAQFVTK